MRKILLLIFVVIILSSCNIVKQEQKENATIPTKQIDFSKIKQVMINNVTIDIEVALTPQEQQRGLMYRNNLSEYSGMLFIFDEPKDPIFWMKNTQIPLDMIFIDENFDVVFIEPNAQPCANEPCMRYGPRRPVKYVLEVSGGLSEKHNFETGELGIVVP